MAFSIEHIKHRLCAYGTRNKATRGEKIWHQLKIKRQRKTFTMKTNNNRKKNYYRSDSPNLLYIIWMATFMLRYCYCCCLLSLLWCACVVARVSGCSLVYVLQPRSHTVSHSLSECCLRISGHICNGDEMTQAHKRHTICSHFPNAKWFRFPLLFFSTPINFQFSQKLSMIYHMHRITRDFSKNKKNI